MTSTRSKGSPRRKQKPGSVTAGKDPNPASGAKILFLDIELKPLLVYTFGIWDQKIAPNQIKEDWSIISWAAKWLHGPAIFQMDLKGARDHNRDKVILAPLWRLLNEADVVVTQNGISFDEKKINARFIKHDIEPVAPFKSIDTKRLAKKRFGFTSNSLEYMNDFLNIRPKKKSKKFPGMELWIECLKNNEEAWDEMARYNVDDVLATEALYKRLKPWGINVDLNLYRPKSAFACSCGSKRFERRGYAYTASGKWQRLQCREASCRAWTTDKTKNLLSPAKRLSLKGP